MRSYKESSKPMTKPAIINKLKFILGSASIFLISYVLGVNLIIPLFLACIFTYLRLTSKNYSILNLSLLFLIIFVSGYFVIKRAQPIYYIPFPAIAMLSTILFNDLALSLLITLASSIGIAYLANNNYLALLLLISGILSSIFVLGARRRVAIIRAGFFAGLIQAVALLFIEHFGIKYPEHYLMVMLNGIASGVIVIGTLPVFEYLFKTATNISLLELADFNQPLLHRMILEAPGTYHHSLVVGNLSEAASLAVGANPLLARIGAYYHDIGKMQKPEYFSENQDIQSSKHDNLSPTMSKLIIMNHVSEGLGLAKKYNLNPRLTDFILQHHGTSLVYYFYRRALEGLEEDQEIREEGFRYPGPKPNTKETAIVLLADAVEAATRALKEPTPTNITDVVHKIINNKFIDGQLDECDLTLKDLEKISEIFIRILSGIYHARITYPEGNIPSKAQKVA